MVFLFKGIAPPSQFPATVASGAPPRPNHPFFQDGVDVRFEPLGGAGVGGGSLRNVRTTSFLKKKVLILSLNSAFGGVSAPWVNFPMCLPVRR